MPRYFFHSELNYIVKFDNEGVDLPGPDEAHSQALVAAKNMLDCFDRERGNWLMRVSRPKGPYGKQSQYWFETALNLGSRPRNGT